MTQPHLEARNSQAQPWGTERITETLYVLVTLLCVALIVIPQNLPFHDLPNHLARYYIMARDSHTALTTDLYNIHFGLTPNIGFDVLADLLGHIVPSEYAVKIILTASLMCFSLGTYLLSKSRNCGSLSPTILLLPVVFFSYSFLMGYLNFVLASSAIPIIFYFAERTTSSVKMAFLVATSLLVIYFAHLMAALILFALFAFLAAKQIKTTLGKSIAITTLITMVVIVILYKMGTLTGEANVVRLSSIGNKFSMLRSTFGVGSRQFIFGDVLYGILIVALLFRRAVLSRVDFVLIAILSLMYLVCPFGLTLTANLDGRLVPIALGFFVTLVKWQKSKGMASQYLWIASYLIVGLIGLYSIGHMTFKGSEESRKIRSYAQKMNTGDMLIPMDINVLDSQNRSTWDPGLRMIPYFAICEKQLIMPGIFMFESQEPVTVKPGNPILDFVNGQEVGDSDQMQLDNGVEKVKKLLAESRSFSKTPVYLVIVNHAHRGIPTNKDIRILEQDDNIGLALLSR